MVGCFEIRHIRTPLQELPEDPKTLNTTFYLFTRSLGVSNPEVIRYGDGGSSLTKSKFNFSRPTKIVIHGYLGKWDDRGGLITAETYLKMVSRVI